MRFKHVLFLATLICAFAEIGMALYAMHWGSIVKDIAYADQPQPNSEFLVVRALNIALPVLWLTVTFQVYLRRKKNTTAR